jgi:hypothetical protein
MSALTDDERRDLLMSVGTHRSQRRLSPIGVAQLFRKAMDGGESLSWCASAVDLSNADMVKRFLRLLDLPPSVQVTVAWRGSDTTLAFTAATEVARLPKHLQEQTAHEALAYRLSSSEVKYVVQRIARSGRDPRSAVEEIVALRPAVERHHVFIGVFSSADLGKRIDDLEQDERDELLAATLATLTEEPHAAVRLTPAGFVISGGDRLADIIRGLGDFETSISEAMRERVDRA